MDDVFQKIATDLLALGVRPGGVLLVHSSLRSLGPVPGGAETVIRGLLAALGKTGTLLMPALTYETVTRLNPVFDVRFTPSCVGALPEYFRTRAGTRRSLHPTHSVCGIGPRAEQLLTPHAQDCTPCGPNSPFHRLPEFQGQILMLGCGLEPNTSLHAIEELIEPPYLYAPHLAYTLIDENGLSLEKEYRTHNFAGWEQHYARAAEILVPPDLHTGKVLQAQCHLIEARALREAACHALAGNPFFFVDRIPEI